MDFTIAEPLVALQSPIRHFIAEQVIPLAGDPRRGPHGPDKSLRAALVGRHFAGTLARAGATVAGAARRTGQPPACRKRWILNSELPLFSLYFDP